MLGCGENNNTNKLERVSIEKLINKGKGADPSGQLGDGKNTNPTDLLIYYKGKLFTGLAFDGKYEMTFKNGKIDGMLESYHNNGQLMDYSEVFFLA